MKPRIIKRAMSLILSTILTLPLIGAGATVSASSNCTIATLTDYNKAAERLTVYTTADVNGTNHSFGENAGSYKFDAAEQALSITKSSANYMGGYYRFHLKMKDTSTLPTSQPWMVVSYKTNATDKVKFNMESNAGNGKVTIANDISVSGGEWVFSAPVNISGALLDRLAGGNHNAMIVELPANTSNSTYFYIKTIAFFETETAAKNYIEHGVIPHEGTGGTTSTAGTTGTSAFVGGSYTHEDSTIATSLWVPKSYSPDKEYALLIYFHNVGGRGDTPYFNGGKGNALTKNIIDKYGDEFIIFAPRCPSAYRWAEADWASGTYVYSRTPISKPMSAVTSYIYDEIFETYNIDKSRVYAAGDSMGGGGTWDLILREPDLLAAALPVAGYNDPSQAANIRDDLKLWIVHTAQDKSVNVAGDRAMYAALKNMGRDVRYTEYDTSKPEDKALFNNSWDSSPNNWEHWAWVPAYNNMEMIDWLVSQKKETTEEAPESKYTDVSADNRYYKAINALAALGYMNGTGDGTTFSPDMTITRSMFVTILGRIAGVDVAKYATPTLSDVEAGKWYTAYVGWASANGIVNGYPDGRFGVNDPITTQDALVILSRYAKSENAEADTQLATDRFYDFAKIPDYAKDSVAWALRNGVYIGESTSVGQLKPTAEASRALIASIIYNYTEIFGK